MKKAFSLIEIMQTIILLGIIAGLSISFFKKMNTNDKLWHSTEAKLLAAIEEANRQMCSDDTPTCYVNDRGSTYIQPYSILSQRDADDLCSAVYTGSTYDPESKYCVATVGAGDDCPSIAVGAPDGNDYETMQKKPGDDPDDDATCIAAPPCGSPYNVPVAEPYIDDDTYAISYNDANTTYRAFPLSDYTCANNVPNYQSTVTSGNIPVLCYYLHSLLVHKPQGVNYDGDLIRTCSSDTTVFQSNASEVDADTVSNQITDEARAANGGDNYSMLLPNGVYLYNLGGSFLNSDNLVNIYVKYDRVQTTASAKYVLNGANFDSKKSTIGVLQIKNPIAVKIAADVGGGAGGGAGGEGEEGEEGGEGGGAGGEGGEP